MLNEFEKRVDPIVHQMVGAATGIILCAWFVGAAPEQVALIRLPSTLTLTAYWLAAAIWCARWGARRPQ